MGIWARLELGVGREERIILVRNPDYNLDKGDENRVETEKSEAYLSLFLFIGSLMVYFHLLGRKWSEQYMSCTWPTLLHTTHFESLLLYIETPLFAVSHTLSLANIIQSPLLVSLAFCSLFLLLFLLFFRHGFSWCCSYGAWSLWWVFFFLFSSWTLVVSYSFVCSFCSSF